METQDYGFVVLTALFTGLVGGMLAGVIWTKTLVAADSTLSTTPVVQAERFEVRDSAGRRRAVLGLVFGKPSLWIADEQGEPRAIVDLLADGEPTLLLLGKQGKAKVAFGLPEGEPSIALVDEGGKSVWKLP
jgi:hypothetical protein